jgi:ABC-type sugar transport system substrate-binding protein
LGRPIRAFLTITAIAATTAIAISGCASASGGATPTASSGGDEIRVLYIGSKLTTFENSIFEGLDSVDGITADFVDHSYDEVKATQAVDDAIVSGKYDAIVTIPITPTALIPSAQRAIEAGIQFVNVASAFGSDPLSTEVQLEGQTASIVDDYSEYGQVQWDMALQYCEEQGIEQCNIARVGGLPQYPSETLFAAAEEAGAKAAGDKANRFDTVYAGGYDSALGLTAGQDLITAHPDVNVILSQDPMMKGVQQAVAESGKTIGLVSQGGTSFGADQVRAGTWYGIVPAFPRTTGMLAGEAIVRHAADPSLKGETLSPVPEGADLAITNKNIDSFEAEYE